jgi:cell division septum initiation protein DivIVA
MPSLKENLDTADRIIEQSGIKPELKELDAIKLYCNFEVKRKAILESLNTTLKELRRKLADARQKLETILGSNECVALSKASCERLDLLSAQLGIEKTPRYCRKLKANKDANITTETIEEALSTLTEEDIKEAAEKSNDKTTKNVIKTLVLTNIRRIIRSFTETTKISKSIQRGSNLYDVPEASEELANCMFEIHKTEQEIKNLLEEKPSEADSTIKEAVEKFFIRTGLTAQRIVVEGSPYKLVRRISIKKTKIGIGAFEKILENVLDTTNSFNTSDLMRSIQIQISEIPPETKSTVGLTAFKNKD